MTKQSADRLAEANIFASRIALLLKAFILAIHLLCSDYKLFPETMPRTRVQRAAAESMSLSFLFFPYIKVVFSTQTLSVKFAVLSV